MEKPNSADTEPAGGSILGELYTRELDTKPSGERGIWAAVYPALLDEIRQPPGDHRFRQQSRPVRAPDPASQRAGRRGAGALAPRQRLA
jgi:hypothetical protein